MKSRVITKKQLWTVVISIIVVLAIATAIVVPLILPKDENIGYSFDDENKPIQYGAVNKLIFNTKLAEMLRVSFFITDKNNYIGTALLNAMSNARIPTEKMLAFADYLMEFGNLIKSSGLSVVNAVFEKGDIKKEDNLFSDFDKYFTDFFIKTGFTELELGRFLYEIAIDTAGESEYGELLSLLGREDFVILTSNSIYSYNMLKTALAEGSGATEARALQAIAYSLGSNYIDIISKLGYEGIEKLFGVAYELDIENTNLSIEDFAIFENTMLASRGKIANLLFILGESIKNTDAHTFELLFSYIGMEDKDSREGKEKLILSHIGLSKAIKKGLDSSFLNYEYTGIADKESFVESYSLLMKEYKKFFEMVEQKEEKSDYDAYFDEKQDNIQTFIDCVYGLSEIDSLNFDAISAEDFDLLIQQSEGLWIIADGAGEYFDQAFSMVFFSFLLKVVDMDALLKNNQKALQDLINDSLQELINNKELEELIEQNN